MWLDREIVHVRDPLRRGLRVMAAYAVLRVELRSNRLLVPQCDLVNREVNVLPRRIPRAGHELIPARLLSERDGACDLSAGVGQRCGGRKAHAGWPAEIDRRAGDTISRGIVDLHHNWLIQRHSGITNLLPAAGLDDRCAAGGGLQARRLLALAGTSSHQQRDCTNSDECKFHFFIASCAPPDLSDIRNAVNERASSSVMCWLGSVLPGRSAWGSFSQ